MREILKGSTDQSVVIRIVDSTDGTPETGVVYNTSGIDLWYRREGAVKTSITEATLSALNDAHTDGGFLHIGDGYYRLDLPDAAVASGADGVAVGGTVTGMVVIGCYIPLVAFNPQSATSLGLSYLTGDSYARLGAPVGASISADVAGVKTQTAAIETDTQDIQTRIPDALTGNGNIKADMLRIAGTAQTARDIGASVLLSSGTGTGQILLSSGVASANAVQISGDATAADTLELFAESLDQSTGQIDSGSLADGTITAAAIATGAIDADALATDAVNEITAAMVAKTQDGVALGTWWQIAGSWGAVATVSGATQTFYKRDGTTGLFSLTKGGTVGERTAMTIL